MGRGLGSGLEFQSARGWFSAGEACCRARIVGGACKRLSFGEGVLGSGSGYRDRIMNQGQSQVLGLELLFSVACTADQACRSGAQGKWHREKSLYTRAWVTVLQRRSGLCAAQIRQRIRFAAVQVYRHGYILFGEEHHVRHAHGGHNYHMGTRRATIYARSPSGGSGFYSHGLYRWFRRRPAPKFKWAYSGG